MPYDRYQPSQKQRSRGYWMQFVAMAATIVAMAVHLLSAHTTIPGVIFGLAIGGILASGLAFRTDDYFRSLCAVGHRFMAVGLAAVTFPWWVYHDLAKDGATTPYSSDPMLFALIVMLCFYVGYAYAFLRDRVWQGGDA